MLLLKLNAHYLLILVLHHSSCTFCITVLSLCVCPIVWKNNGHIKGRTALGLWLDGLTDLLPEFGEVTAGGEGGDFSHGQTYWGDSKGQLPVQRMGHRKHWQETGSRKRKLHPLSLHNTITVATTQKEPKKNVKGCCDFQSPLPKIILSTWRGEDEEKTCNNKLGVIRFHVAIILSFSFSFSLLLGFFSIKWISIVLQNNKLRRK